MLENEIANTNCIKKIANTKKHLHQQQGKDCNRALNNSCKDIEVKRKSGGNIDRLLVR